MGSADTRGRLVRGGERAMLERRAGHAEGAALLGRGVGRVRGEGGSGPPG